MAATNCSSPTTWTLVIVLTLYLKTFATSTHTTISFPIQPQNMQRTLIEDDYVTSYDQQAPFLETPLLDPRVMFYGLHPQTTHDDNSPTNDNIEVEADFGYEYEQPNGRLTEEMSFLPPFIIVGYHQVILNSTRDLWGNILPEDLVRATNKVFYTERDMQRWFRLSNANCPTLGNCQWCFRALPMNALCHICNWQRPQLQEQSHIFPNLQDASRGHLITFGYLLPFDEPSHCTTQVATLDAQWVALMLAPWRAIPKLPSMDRHCDFGSVPGHSYICATHVINCIIRKWTNFLWGYSFPHGPIDFNPRNSTIPTFWTTLIDNPSIIIKIMNMAFTKNDIRLHRLEGIRNDINRWNHDLDLNHDDTDNDTNPNNAARRLHFTQACHCIKPFGNLELPFASHNDTHRYPVDLAITHNSPWQWFPLLPRIPTDSTCLHNPMIPNIDLPDSIQ